MTIFPVRFVLLSLSLIPTAVSAYLIDAVVKPNEKPTGWKSYLVNFTTWLGRIQLHMAGIFVKAWIFMMPDNFSPNSIICRVLCSGHSVLKTPRKIKGTPADSKEARILTLAPHGTLIDGYVLLFHARYHALPSPISAKENRKIPVFGQLISVGKPIWVDRDNLSSKNFVMNEIKKRAEDLDYPQVAIFPEGTLTNSRALMTFKPGAFGPGAAVQPIILRFSGWNTYSWTFGQNPTNLGMVGIQYF